MTSADILYFDMHFLSEKFKWRLKHTGEKLDVYVASHSGE